MDGVDCCHRANRENITCNANYNDMTWPFVYHDYICVLSLSSQLFISCYPILPKFGFSFLANYTISKRFNKFIDAKLFKKKKLSKLKKTKLHF
jgi:hypothetical protein